MIYNKNKYSRESNKKVLHKVKKNWLVFSMSTFVLLGTLYSFTSSVEANDNSDYTNNKITAVTSDQNSNAKPTQTTTTNDQNNKVAEPQNSTATTAQSDSTAKAQTATTTAQSDSAVKPQAATAIAQAEKVAKPQAVTTAAQVDNEAKSTNDTAKSQSEATQPAKANAVTTNDSTISTRANAGESQTEAEHTATIKFWDIVNNKPVDISSETRIDLVNNYNPQTGIYTFKGAQ